MASPLTTHILDTANGVPAVGVPITLTRLNGEGVATILASGVTNRDGRVADLVDPSRFGVGRYCIRFDIAAYFVALGTPSFFPWAEVVFDVTDASRHHHVPLLVSPFGFSTYRGS